MALATAACVVYGAYGLARYGDWLSISTAQALHMLLGEGNPALRRAESAALRAMPSAAAAQRLAR